MDARPCSPSEDACRCGVSKARLKPVCSIGANPFNGLNHLWQREEAASQMELVTAGQNAFMMRDAVSQALNALKAPVNIFPL